MNNGYYWMVIVGTTVNGQPQFPSLGEDVAEHHLFGLGEHGLGHAGLQPGHRQGL